MALSNILKEPRREITESVIGIALVVGLIAGDYYLAAWIVSHGSRKAVAADVAGFMVLIPLATVAAGWLFYGLLHFTHFVGEEVCNSLARRGIELRPKTRYR